MPGGIGGVADPKKDTRTDTQEESATRSCHLPKRSSGDSVMDQDLAQGSQHLHLQHTCSPVSSMARSRRISSSMVPTH